MISCAVFTGCSNSQQARTGRRLGGKRLRHIAPAKLAENLRAGLSPVECTAPSHTEVLAGVKADETRLSRRAEDLLLSRILPGDLRNAVRNEFAAIRGFLRP